MLVTGDFGAQYCVFAPRGVAAMALVMKSAAPALGSARLPSRRPMPLGRAHGALPVVCKAKQQTDAEAPRSVHERMALPLAGMVAAAMLAGAFVPEEAMAARSGGRVGGGGFSGRSSAGMRSAAPSRSAPAPETSVRTYNSYTYAAPPVVVAPSYGYHPSPFGFGGGFGFPTIVPIGFFGGGLLQFFVLMMVISVVFNVISGIASKASSGKDAADNKRDKNGGDGWGDL